jgi:ATP-dependent Clp protease ATP-binding subunit ClpC
MKTKVQEELKQHFRPEFLNRVDEIIVFPPLSQEQIISMVDNMIAAVETRLKDRDMSLELTEGAKHLLAKRGFDPVLGARPLRRTVQREIEDVLAEKMLYGEVGAGQIMPPFETADLGTDPLAELAADGSEDGPRDVPRAGGESSPFGDVPFDDGTGEGPTTATS